MTDKAMRMENVSVPENFFSPAVFQRRSAHCDGVEKNKLQRKENDSQTVGAPLQTENYLSALSGGKKLTNNERSFFEPRFGQDFSNVKIHTDNDAAKSSQAINALAYTVGNDIVFNHNQFSPESNDGKKLLAHELSHVVRQKGSESISRKHISKVDRETFMRENCVNVQVDSSNAKCEFTNNEMRIISIVKGYAVRALGKAILALSILDNNELSNLSKLIFHEEIAPPRKMIKDTIEKVRDKLETTPIVCKNCADEECNKGGIIAYVPPDHSLIEICPLFFNKESLTNTPRYLIHEACHLADVDINNIYSSKYNMEMYCNPDDGKVDYWNNPCPVDIDNLNNADAWSFFIDRLSITV